MRKDVDYIFEEIVGGCGRWQILTTLAMFPVVWVGGYSLFLTVFAAYEPRFRCHVDACDSPASGINESWVDFAIPKEHSSSNFLTVGEAFDPCHQHALLSPNGDGDGAPSCVADAFNASSSVGCDKYIWDRSQFTETLTTRLNLVCGDEYKRRLLSSIMMVGLFFGSLLGGRIGDKIGRKKSLFGAAAFIVPCVVIGGYTPHYELYFLLRLLTCTALPVMWVNNHTYSLEYLSPKYRKLIVCVKDFPAAYFIFILIVHLTRHWTQLHLWTGIASCLALPVYFLVPESPRWLAGNGKVEEAEKIFLNIAKVNKRQLTKEQRQEIRDVLNQVDKESEPNLNPMDMFRHAHMHKTLILLLNWITVCLGYYALTLNSTKLAGDAVLNTLYGVLADSPICVILFFTLDSLGRRPGMAGCQFVLGSACLFMAFAPKTWTNAILVTYLIGKGASGMGFVLVYLITAELFPTNLRAQAVGFSSSVSRVFCAGANFVPYLAVIWQPLPMVVLGVPTIIASILSFFLQETSGKDLPQTMNEAEHIDDEASDETDGNGSATGNGKGYRPDVEMNDVTNKGSVNSAYQP